MWVERKISGCLNSVINEETTGHQTVKMLHFQRTEWRLHFNT